jgi:hypothetical protein
MPDQGFLLLAPCRSQSILVSVHRQITYSLAIRVQIVLATIPLFMSFGFVSNVLTIACGAVTVSIRPNKADSFARRSDNIAIRGLNIAIIVFASLEFCIAILVSWVCFIQAFVADVPDLSSCTSYVYHM